MAVRNYRESDLSDLHAINVASVPGVGAATLDELAEIIALSTCFVATDLVNAPLGFITLLPTGVQAYDSPNLRWFEKYVGTRNVSLIYVDRIALSPSARGQKLGEALYRTAFEHFADCNEIGCEVNTAPPNPGSHRFHQRLGFSKVGEQEFQPGAKSVAYYVRPLGQRTSTD